MLDRLAALAFLVVLITAALVGPAQAEADPVDDLFFREGWVVPDRLSEDTLRLLLHEIALLYELDAFAVDNSAQFERIHRAFGEWPETTRTQVFEVLTAIDVELATRVRAFNLLPAGQNQDLAFTVGQLPPEWKLRLLAGEPEFISGHEYIATLDKLLIDGAPPAFRPPGAPPPSLEVQLADALQRLADAHQLNQLLDAEIDELGRMVAEMVTDQRTTPPGPNWLLIAAGAACGGVLLGIAAMTLRRHRSVPNSGTTEVIEAHRLLTGARSEAEVAEITTSAARQLARGSDAVLLRSVPEGLRVAGTVPIITSSSINRVVETGQPLLATLQSDPLWPSSPVAVAAVPVVHEGIIIGAVVVWREANREFNEETRDRLELLVPAVGGALARAEELGSMETMAMVDGLTSLGNRRRLDGDLETALASATAADRSVGFAMIDVDHFKIYNDTHGHGAGDNALKAVARCIAACVRAEDVVYRYGGEEFSILLPGATPDEAFNVAERVRCSIETLELPGEQLQPGGRLTVSVGIATLETGPATNLKERADAALYRAKSKGRNQVALD